MHNRTRDKLSGYLVAAPIHDRGKAGLFSQIIISLGKPGSPCCVKLRLYLVQSIFSGGTRVVLGWFDSKSPSGVIYSA